jgi:hypothetical protein
MKAGKSNKRRPVDADPTRLPERARNGLVRCRVCKCVIRRARGRTWICARPATRSRPRLRSTPRKPFDCPSAGSSGNWIDGNMPKPITVNNRIAGRATFTGMKPTIGEAYKRVPGPITVAVIQVSRWVYEAMIVDPIGTARWKRPLRNMAGVDIRGPIDRVMIEIAERFEELANPWVFKLGDNVIGRPPARPTKGGA